MLRLTSTNDMNRSPGIIVAFGLALGPAVALGLARFAYALLLPSMRSQLHWSFTIAGLMNAVNALGYLVGALLATPLARRYGTRETFITSTIVTVLSLLATGISGNIPVLLSLRTLAGIVGAISFVTGAGLVAELGSTSSPQRAASLLGIYFAGGGAGIVLSGIAVPFLLAAASSATGWRLGWVLLAGLGILSLGFAIPAARASREPPSPPPTEKRWPARQLGPLFACYALFGMGYIAYMTFIIAYLKDHSAGPTVVSIFWVVLGVAAMVGTFAWTRPISTLRGGRGPALVLAVLSIGAILPLLSRSPIAVIGSAVLFGGSFLSVVAAVTAVSRRFLQPHHWTPAIAGLTVAFALGQSIGPVLAGALSNGSAGLTLGLDISAAILVISSIVALAQPLHEIPMVV